MERSKGKEEEEEEEGESEKEERRRRRGEGSDKVDREDVGDTAPALPHCFILQRRVIAPLPPPNSLAGELGELIKLSQHCDIQVPLEILNLIDQGSNPDAFTRDILNSCISKNQFTKGKTDSFKSLRKHLLEELEQVFPTEVESYREIRASSAAEMKRMVQAQGALPNGDVKVKNEL